MVLPTVARRMGIEYEKKDSTTKSQEPLVAPVCSLLMLSYPLYSRHVITLSFITSRPLAHLDSTTPNIDHGDQVKRLYPCPNLGCDHPHLRRCRRRIQKKGTLDGRNNRHNRNRRFRSQHMRFQLSNYLKPYNKCALDEILYRPSLITREHSTLRNAMICLRWLFISRIWKQHHGQQSMLKKTRRRVAANVSSCDVIGIFIIFHPVFRLSSRFRFISSMAPDFFRPSFIISFNSFHLNTICAFAFPVSMSLFQFLIVPPLPYASCISCLSLFLLYT